MSSTTTKKKMRINQLGECSDWNALHSNFVTMRTTSGGLKRSMTSYFVIHHWKPNYSRLTGYSRQYPYRRRCHVFLWNLTIGINSSSIPYLLSSFDMIVYLLLAFNLSNNHGRKYTQDCLFLLQVFPTLYINMYRIRKRYEWITLFCYCTVSRLFITLLQISTGTCWDIQAIKHTSIYVVRQLAYSTELLVCINQA